MGHHDDVPFFAFTLIVPATILADWSLEERVRRADCIVMGVVAEAEVVRDERGRVWTETTIVVERALAGQVSETVVVSQLGGRLGDRTVDVSGTAPLPTGVRVLLLLQSVGRRTVLVAMSQGAFHLHGDLAYQAIRVPLAAEDGRLRPPPGIRTVAVATLEALAGAK